MADLLNDSEIKNILVIQFRQIGDVLLSTPFVRILKRHFPDSRIDFLTEPGPAQVLQNNENINSILLFRHRREHVQAVRFYRSLKANRYDLTLDLQGTSGTALASWFSGARYRVGYRLRIRRLAYTVQVPPPGEGQYTALNRLCLLKAIGIHDEEWKIDLQLSDKEHDAARKIIEDRGWRDEFLISMSPTSRRQTRRWRAEGFIETAKLFVRRYNARILLLWGPGEEEYVKEIAEAIGDHAFMIPSVGMKEMGAFIALTRLLITNNNGPKHIATALCIPTVTIYGSSSEKAWNPPDTINHKVVKADIPCIGCHLSYCEHLTCMHLVNERDVEKAVFEIPALSGYAKDVPRL